MTDQRHDRAPKRSRDDRTPPHNLEAEESLLGACLFAPSAVAVLVDRLTPGDFYRPAHAHIARAVSELAAAGAHVDPITVAARLDTAGLLDEAGGIPRLHELMNLAPSAGGAATYAGIVSTTARLRRMIWTAGDLADAAFNHADPLEALTKAQAALGQLSIDPDQASTLDIADVAALLATDLTPEQGAYLTRSDGTSLLYAGKTHTLQAEPSTGKSWVAIATVAEVLAVGGSAVYLDYEDTPAGIVKRLLNVGAASTAVAERFAYARPVGNHGPVERRQLERLLVDLNPDVVIIDGMGESLSRNGLSEDKADDILRWFDLLPRPIAETGAAVLMIDHVAKDPEQRGRWARGSGAKLGAIDGATYQVKLSGAFSRKRAGALRLVIAKDRPGGVGAIGETAAVVSIEPHGDGERVMLRIEPGGAALPSTDRHKPTNVMAQVCHEIEQAAVPPTAKALEALVHARPVIVREALARLIAEGFVAEGTRRPKTLRVVRTYNGATTRAEPLEELEPDPVLFDSVPDEPAWITEERRAAQDSYATDPDL